MKINYDSELNIQTSGWIYWPWEQDEIYYESEPTGYRELDELFKHYEVPEGSHFVDVGCGKGRFVFYVNHFLKVPVTGVEYHPETFRFLEANLKSYEVMHPNHLPITLVQESAVNFPLMEEYSVFYFFNPFAPSIFEQTFAHILKHLEQFPRTVDFIFYCPVASTTHLLETYEKLTHVDSIPLKWYREPRERFDIYRYTPCL